MLKDLHRSRRRRRGNLRYGVYMNKATKLIPQECKEREVWLAAWLIELAKVNDS